VGRPAAGTFLLRHPQGVPQRQGPQRALLENDLPADGFVFDTALAAYLLDSTQSSYELQRLYVTYFNTELPQPVFLEKDAFSLLADRSGAEAALDSHVAAVSGLYDCFVPRLREREQWELYQTAELPLCRVLAEMELTGCRVDAGALTSFGELMETRCAALEKEICAAAGGEFNINSPKQLGEVLFERLGCPTGKRPRPAGPPTPTCWKSCGP
jgi:DNA polymerase-1